MIDAARLRDAGLRVTSARLAILEAVSAGDHPGADEIARAVRGRIGHFSTQAVYEALNALTSAGLVRRIEPAAGAGFAIDEAEVTFWGLCAHCQAAVSAAGPVPVPRRTRNKEDMHE